jgi:hypothetical protein
MQNITQTQLGGTVLPAPKTIEDIHARAKFLKEYVLSFMDFLTKTKSEDGSTWRLPGEPLVLEATEFGIAVWDVNRKNIIKRIFVVDDNCRVLSVAEVWHDLSTVVETHRNSFQLGMDSGYSEGFQCALTILRSCCEPNQSDLENPGNDFSTNWYEHESKNIPIFLPDGTGET